MIHTNIDMYTIFLYIYIYLYICLPGCVFFSVRWAHSMHSHVHIQSSKLHIIVSVCCGTAQWLVRPHLWMCAHGEPLLQRMCPRGIIGMHPHSLLLHPKTQTCACGVREKGCPARSWLERRQGSWPWCAERHLFLEDAATCRDGLVPEPPWDFMLKCHEMRHRNSTDFPGRSVICSMLSGHDTSVPGLLLLGQLCEGRVQHCGRTSLCAVQSILHFSQEFLCGEPHSFAYALSKTNHKPPWENRVIHSHTS